jgi:sirohydrochlorin cobaltochelatase
MGGEIGIMVCGHGSRDDNAVTEFASVAAGIRERLPHYPVESGFLEFATPVIRDGLDKLRDRGCTRILALPGMLFAAGHAKNDSAGDAIPAHETLLAVVGRGASDPDANSNVAKITRMLWEGMGFGWAETVYSGVTFPLVEPGLEHAVKLGFRRIVVFPYFLFTGRLVKRIYDHTDIVAARHPRVEFIKGPYLNDHPLVLDCFADRAMEILDGQNLMNCALCKYREQVLGFESEVGLAQQSHHHHVEGIGTDAGSDHDHGHEQKHRHDHAHHHHPYPHADHPLGPVTMEKLKAREGSGE